MIKSSRHFPQFVISASVLKLFTFSRPLSSNNPFIPSRHIPYETISGNNYWYRLEMIAKRRKWDLLNSQIEINGTLKYFWLAASCTRIFTWMQDFFKRQPCPTWCIQVDFDYNSHLLQPAWAAVWNIWWALGWGRQCRGIAIGWYPSKSCPEETH